MKELVFGQFYRLALASLSATLARHFTYHTHTHITECIARCLRHQRTADKMNRFMTGSWSTYLLHLYSPQSQTLSKTQTNKRTDARNRNRCILALQYDIWWQYFNDFPDDQLTKFRVFIGRFRIFISLPLIFLWSIALRPPIKWTPLTDTQQTNNKRVSLSVRCLCLRWSLTHIVYVRI